jgi:hypothetical protein
MDTQGSEAQGRRGEGRDNEKRRLPRVLTIAAVACFALPFLTVTCYGETTVSGVQAATEIDLYPNDNSGEAELVREEDPNLFAIAALAAAILALALAFGSARSRELPRKLMVWTAAVGAIALVGLYAYAFYRSWGGAWPRVGFVGALMCLVAASWTGVGHAPRWVGFATAAVAASMIPGTVIGIDDLPEVAWLHVPVYAGVFIAVALAVGAMRASLRASEPVAPSSQPSTFRVVCAGAVGLACLAVAAVGAPILMNGIIPGQAAPADAGSSYLFATGVIAMTTAASAASWIAGSAIAHGRSRVSVPSMPAEVRV